MTSHTPTTAAAQRRLLEAIAGVCRPRGLVAGLYGAAETTAALASLSGRADDLRSAEQIGAVYEAMADLVSAVTNEREVV